MQGYLMDELWQPIDGYQGLYEVSNLGRVRSLDRSVAKRGRAGVMMTLRLQGKILQPQPDGGKRLFVTLSKNGKYKPTKVHKLVAAAFIGPRPEGLDINHIDGDHQNNAVSNLEYCTRSENMKHAVRLGLVIPPSRAGSKDRPQPSFCALNPLQH